MPLPLIALGVLAAAGVKAYIGARQQAKAKQLAAQNTRPNFDIQKEYFTNRDLAENAAQSGLPQSTLNYATNNLDRALGASTGALLQTGGGPNQVSSLFDQYSQGLGGIASADAQMKSSNINRLMQANNDLASQRTMQWSLNKYQPYLNVAQESAQLRATGSQNVSGAISQVGSAAANYAMANNYQLPTSNTNGNSGGSADQQVAAMNSQADRNLGNTFGNPNLRGSDPSAMQSNQLINDALQNNMESSPYQDLIRQRLQQQYGSMNQGYLGTTA